jgi:Outer membrane lipoprotein carrier protein LolA-like
MIYRAVLALFALTLSFPALAADPLTDQVIVGPNAVLRGHFTEERQMKGFNEPLRSEGHFVVAPGHGLIWATEKPFPTASTITPNGLVQDVGGKKVMQVPVKKIPFLSHLYDMLGGALAGHWQVLEKDFIVTPESDADGWQVTLQPRQTDNLAMPFQTIIIKGGRFVESALLQKADGDFDSLTFSDTALFAAPPSRAETAAFDSVGP